MCTSRCVTVIRNIATWYLKDKIRRTEATKDIANVPRLSTLSNENNYQTSTQGPVLSLNSVI